MKFWGQYHLYVDNMHTKFQVRKIYKKEDMQDLSTWDSCEKVSQLPTLTPSQGLRKFFLPMELLESKHLYVDYMCENFQVQKIHKKQNIPNLQTCVVVRKVLQLPPMLVDFKYHFFEYIFWPWNFSHMLSI